ncbi:MAG: hypothetical protein ACRECY_19410 [Phyllobacterium sp.]
MIEQNFPSWESRDKNKVNNLVICGAQPITGTHYAILYRMMPSRSKGIDIEFVVKSAYQRYFDMAKTGKREKIRVLIKKSHYTGITLPKS